MNGPNRVAIRAEVEAQWRECAQHSPCTKHVQRLKPGTRGGDAERRDFMVCIFGAEWVATELHKNADHMARLASSE